MQYKSNTAIPIDLNTQSQTTIPKDTDLHPPPSELLLLSDQHLNIRLVYFNHQS
ncbi:hypothetical protein LINGRAHAP2_LOCUS22502 [Linum grandiflorum]